ncbi:MAG: hypothetical protein KF803_02800 [Cyclobacteriaceae bacterium]|nr:hypothetical protein [Cyclobacteriaceae bacterium]
MNEIFLIVADYFKGKSIYHPLRRALNLLFLISISSFIYEYAYGKYEWLDITDYKGILTFLIKGNFFIPLSIFIAVYTLTEIVSVTVFSVLNYFATVRMTRQIIHYQINKDTVDQNMSDLAVATKHLSPITLSGPQMLELFQYLRASITTEIIHQIEEGIKVPKRNMEATFHTTFRAMLASIIYFISLDQFGWKLFTITLITLLIVMYLTMLAYRLLDLFPTLVRKFNDEVIRYFEQNKTNNTVTTHKSKTE